MMDSVRPEIVVFLVILVIFLLLRSNLLRGMSGGMTKAVKKSIKPALWLLLIAGLGIVGFWGWKEWQKIPQVARASVVSNPCQDFLKETYNVSNKSTTRIDTLGCKIFVGVQGDRRIHLGTGKKVPGPLVNYFHDGDAPNIPQSDVRGGRVNLWSPHGSQKVTVMLCPQRSRVRSNGCFFKGKLYSAR